MRSTTIRSGGKPRHEGAEEEVRKGKKEKTKQTEGIIGLLFLLCLRRFAFFLHRLFLLLCRHVIA